MDYREKVLYLLQKHNQDTDELKASISELKASLAETKREVTTVSRFVEAPQFVDLDLPSGTLWMDRNIGAKLITDFGLYFQWGATVVYSDADIKTQAAWKNCPGNNGNEKADTEALEAWDKKCLSTSKSHFLPPGNLLTTVDAAYAYTHGAAKMPTEEQLTELGTSTEIFYTLDYRGSGIGGYIFSSKKDISKFIFIPASGSVSDGGIWDRGNYGVIWTSSLNKDTNTKGLCLTFNLSKNRVYESTHFRYEGLCVRGVSVK